MISTRIAVIGSGSMIGSRFIEQYEEKNNNSIVKADLNSAVKTDITDKDSVDALFKDQDFDAAILFSGYTDVDGAQEQKDDKEGICWKINVDGARNVAEAAKKYQKKLIFISTEFVFDGTKGPYGEEDSVAENSSKVSWYGYTKMEAEKVVKNTLPDAIILRITYPYRAGFEAKDDFAKIILRKHKEGSLYPMFDDQTLTPTFIDDVEPTVKLLLKSEKSGTFHLASPKATTPYEFARELLKVFGQDAQNLKKGSIKEFLKRAKATPRPVSGGLKVDKITSLGFSPTTWKEGIREVFSQSHGKLI